MLQLKSSARARVLASAALAGAVLACAVGSGVAQAQAGKFGTYEGTVQVQGAEVGKLSFIRYRASLKVRMPLTEKSATMGIAEVSDVGAPSGTALVQQWDTSQTDSSPDSGGKINTVTCSLAKPVEVPLIVQGTLNVNYKAKTHSMYFSTVGMKEVALNCKHTRSGASKKSGSVAFFFGTNEPDVQPWKELPFSDAARLSASHKLMPVSQMKGLYEPQNQDWDLRLQK